MGYQIVLLIPLLFIVGNEVLAGVTNQGLNDAAKLLLNNIDPSVDPCNNFYGFACGKFMANNQPNSSGDMPSTLANAQKPLYNKLALYLASIVVPSNPTITPQSVQAAAKVYQTCMATTTQQNAKRAYLLNVIGSLNVGGWPIITNNWNSSAGNRKIESVVGELDSSYGTQSLLHSFVDVDFEFPTKTALYTGPPTLALGNRQYYIDPMFASVRVAYLKTIVSTSKILRAQSGSNVSDVQIMNDAQKILNFEINLARLTRPRGERRVKQAYINTYSIDQISYIWPNFYLDSYYGSLFFLGFQNPAYLDSLAKRLIIQSPGYLDELQGIFIEKYSRRDILNYVIWRFVYNHMDYLPGPIKSTYEELQKTIHGVKSAPPSSHACIQLVNRYMPFAIGKLYEMSTPMGHVQDDINNMLSLIKSTFSNSLAHTPWLDSVSSSNLQQKLSQVSLLVGFPRWMLDPVQLDAYYSNQILGLVHNQTLDLWSALFTMRSGFMKTYYSQLSYPVDKSNWTASVIALGKPTYQDTWYDEGGTTYDLGRNSLTIPIGEIIAPFYRYDFPPVMNFAGLGSSIAHMMTHGFDDIGVQIDASGHLNNLLQPASQTKLYTSSQCFISQYTSTCYPSVNYQCIDGYKTLGENMADAIGLSNAYHAYKIYSKQNGPQANLTGLESYSLDQIFFLQYANSFCSNYGQRALLNALKTGVTSPPDASVNNVINNIPEFAHAFPCPSGSKMAKPTNQQCHIYGTPNIPATPSPSIPLPHLKNTSTWNTVAIQTRSNIDATTSPCQDFYQFSCGGWLAANPLVNNTQRISIQDSARSGTMILLSQALQNLVLFNPNQPQTYNAAKIYYDSCTSYYSSPPANPYSNLQSNLLTMINGWPAATNHWTVGSTFTSNGWGVVGQLEYRWLIPTLTTVYVSTDWKNVSSNAVFIDQGTLGLQDKRFYIEPMFNNRLQMYHDLIVQVIHKTRTLNNLTISPTQVEADVQSILQFETMLARNMVSKSVRDQNVAAMYNKYTPNAILKQWPYIRWDDYFNNLGIHLNLNLVNPEFIIKEPQYIDALHYQLKSVSNRTLANYLGWRYLLANLEFIDPSMRIKYFLTKPPAPVPNKIQNHCAEQIIRLMPFAAGRLYIQQLMKTTNVSAIRRDVSFMIQMLQDISWMDMPTKQIALSKAYGIIQNIGYPDWIMNNIALDSYHTGYINSKYKLTMNSSYFKNYDNLKINYLGTIFRRILIPSDRNYFLMSPASDFAFNQYWLNSVTIPMGQIQAPFYTYSSPHSFHFGSLGSIAGHQIGHGFDTIGTYFAADGTLMNWLSPFARVPFQTEAQCLVTQYNTICYPSLGICIPGQQTVFENLSEAAGVRAAFYAYKKYEASNGAEPMVPGLEEFSHEQLFFIKFAQRHCENISPNMLKDEIAASSRAPSKVRVNAVLQNIPQFSKAFKCQPTDPMAQLQCKVWA